MRSINLQKTLGINASEEVYPNEHLVEYINLKLAAMGCPTVPVETDSPFHDIAESLIASHHEQERLLSNYLCPADWRIQKWLTEFLGESENVTRLPSKSFVLDRHGVARTLSLPLEGDAFRSEIVHSYRIRQGVLHNPVHDRRTTKGVFHIADGGLPVPADKIAAPLVTFNRMLGFALNPPSSLMRLPFTSQQENQAECFVSLLLRPLVVPEVPGVIQEKRSEIRFFAPGNLVGNLDFVESIFGNAGDPHLPENDAGLDVHHWTGHTGCVILAPHLTQVKKKDAGLPHHDQASESQRQQGMCWKDPEELYNNGTAFKLCARDEKGVMVTIIADNYFGYCKKEVKTQISFSANLYGLAEEEHAGGAMVFPSYDLGEEFSGHLHVRRRDHEFEEMVDRFGDIMDLKPEGYAVDKRFHDILYVSENVHFHLDNQTITWPFKGKTESMKLLAGRTYVRPSGYKVQMVKPPGTHAWRLIGTVAEGLLCHKPCTVSGGGKSEISKPVTDAVIQGPVIVANIKLDLGKVDEILKHDFGNRFRDSSRQDERTILSPGRSLGSVIKLLTPSVKDYTEAYNAWLETIPQYIKELVFVLKRHHKPEWGNHWRHHFTVDLINGKPGNELKFDNRKLVTNYMRVGFQDDGLWRTFGLRKDFHPAAKQSLEDDITASVVVSTKDLEGTFPTRAEGSVKFIENCEYRFFQRPDDAIIRGYDKQAESDLSQPGNFISNFEPLETSDADEIIEDAIGFHQYTSPMQELVKKAGASIRPRFFVSSAHPRIVDGKPSKNPRYLQVRPDLIHERTRYLEEISMRLHRKLGSSNPLYQMVDAIVPGRRNNPADVGANIPPLAVYNPIHYMGLPELFMEYICSMTGKSPSTTGAGSEGALTKGPFNALPPVIDLNNALVSMILTGHDGFVTAAGYIGPKVKVAHDVSMLIPEVWCRMKDEERSASYLMDNGYLEKCEDVEHKGKMLPFSRLGYRINHKFVRDFFGRVFNHPHAVFSDDMLQPEKQGLDTFTDGLSNIVATQARVGQMYFEDRSIQAACPPLKALLNIMVHGSHDGKSLADPEIRELFTLEYLQKSDWYLDRLSTKQRQDMQLWDKHIQYLNNFLAKKGYKEEAVRLQISDRLAEAEATRREVAHASYLKFLRGTIGVQPLKVFQS
jgi:hypothetical protein